MVSFIPPFRNRPLVKKIIGKALFIVIGLLFFHFFTFVTHTNILKSVKSTMIYIQVNNHNHSIFTNFKPTFIVGHVWHELQRVVFFCCILTSYTF